MKRKKLWIGLAIALLLAAIVGANFYFKRETGKTVNVEAVRKRDLTALVSASGTIQAKRDVEISADVSGRITSLTVDEGMRVKKGQFLLEIDPRELQSIYAQNQAGLSAAQSQLIEQRSQITVARERLDLARETVRRQRELWQQQLTTKQALDQAENDVKLREAELKTAEQQVTTLQARVKQEQASLASARYRLSKVRIESPIDGLVVRRNVEEGETAVVGTMNNPGTVLLAIADMSVIEAEVEVDETDIPTVQIGQAAKVEIDALPNQSFTGKVTEVGNSPIQQASQQQQPGGAGQQATNFKVVITLDRQIPDVRPGFTCTAEIATAARRAAVSVPIQAMAVRELVFDKAGNVVRPKVEEKGRRRRPTMPTASAEELPPGQSRKETEGVFVVRNERAVFVPVKTGIAGEKYFEVMSGLKEGDQVVTGPFNSVRDLQDGDQVKVEGATRRGRGAQRSS
jgi:HlyD family secretion protein